MTRRIVDDLMHTFFNEGKKFNIYVDTADVSEFLRYTLCLALDLESTSVYTARPKEVKTMVEKFKEVLLARKFPKKSTKKYKQGILEACVHSIEIARKNIEKNWGYYDIFRTW